MANRDETIKAIKNVLRARSGKTWSVKGGRGTAYGWISISVAPKALGCARNHGDIDFHTLTCNDCGESARSTDMQGCAAHVCTEKCHRAYMTPEQRQELAALLGLDNVHPQGVDIAAGHAYYNEYVARAAGLAPEVVGVPYWD